MKLNNNGCFWTWDEPTRETDEALMRRQRIYKDCGLSIWGTRDCQRCGACCYKFIIPRIKAEQYLPCPYQTSSEEGASCDLHGKKKPWGCKRYGCWDKRFKMGTDAERLQLMHIAVDILHTKTQANILETLAR